MAGSAELLVERLRSRRRRVVLVIVGFALILGMQITTLLILSRRSEALVPQPDQDSLEQTIVAMQANVTEGMLETLTFVTCAMAVLAVVTVYLVASYTKNDLLVELWDRVQALEQSSAPKPEPDDSNP